MNEIQERWLDSLLKNRKYRRLNLSADTVKDLIHQVQTEGVPGKQVEKAVRLKLHNIAALYLETVNYETALIELQTIPDGDSEALQTFAARMLSAHTSTQERMSTLEEFYQHIAAALQRKDELKILDLACGLNPFALPWMHLPVGCTLQAYDLHGARIDLLNLFFEKGNLPAQAYHADILANIPQDDADAVFFFKEAHRFEQRRKGSTREFLARLQSPLIFLSLPAYNMTGKHDLRTKHTCIVDEAVAGTSWQAECVMIGNEMLFTIRK
jgi:16S rRNA (guanine(1405)-N(7))-methyltransferase